MLNKAKNIVTAAGIVSRENNWTEDKNVNALIALETYGPGRALLTDTGKVHLTGNLDSISNLDLTLIAGNTTLPAAVVKQAQIELNKRADVLDAQIRAANYKALVRSQNIESFIVNTLAAAAFIAIAGCLVLTWLTFAAH